VDGQAESVGVVDGALVGVRLAQGSHAVHLEYVPGGLGTGLLVSGLTGIALILAWWWWDALVRRLLSLVARTRRPAVETGSH
jgi:uncharacterized membrane protein YfhO